MRNILIITQKVDRNDDVLGFFHGWIAEFAKHCGKVTVICLQKGEYRLPENVSVLSLGKEENQSRTQYLRRFYRSLWRERTAYDAVFVHMNQEYVLLGGLLWKLWGKKIMLWRNHHAGNFLTHIAMMLSDRIFCTSKYSFTARSKKTILMPVGVDTNFFKKENNSEKMKNSLLFLARMSAVKKPHLVIEAVRIVRNHGINIQADFYGKPLAKDVPYLESLKEKVKNHHLEGSVRFKGGIPNRETPHIYNTHEIFINPSPSGMYDKTIFEAMACESLMLTSNLNLKGVLDDRFLFKENDEKECAEKIERLLRLDAATKESYGKMLREHVIKHHSLELLARRLSDYFLNV